MCLTNKGMYFNGRISAFKVLDIGFNSRLSYITNITSLAIKEFFLFHTDPGKTVCLGTADIITAGLHSCAGTSFFVPLLDNQPVITQIWTNHYDIWGLEFDLYQKSTYRIKDIVADIIRAREYNPNFWGITRRPDGSYSILGDLAGRDPVRDALTMKMVLGATNALANLVVLGVKYYFLTRQG